MFRMKLHAPLRLRLPWLCIWHPCASADRRDRSCVPRLQVIECFEPEIRSTVSLAFGTLARIALRRFYEAKVFRCLQSRVSVFDGVVTDLWVLLSCSGIY